ncbi:CPBP family intramembrane glutamic endopeptidase [Kribbella italica]|uniref:Membrane protease YdiL (CAAX protease family) n=1 Tax=Kribbella italica TaxID=1540520 RepID=A0A7W9J5A6_9ACTN|nr:CPBP family intramembrane glutamic endopeptidase [Kribbella italica]MBB5835897.1 membrane protease YdiL (CAAX protease family) [Kribbella italica]
MEILTKTPIADRLLAERHSWPLTIALHLAPGALVVAAYFLIAHPLVQAINYPAFLAWAIALFVVLVPAELGLLLWLGRCRNGRWSLRGVVHYLDRPVPRRRLVPVVVLLIVQFLVISLALVPFDNLVYDTFFTWLPFEGAGGSVTTYLDGYPHSVMVIALASGIPLTGLSLPLIEELYFRGFLMPRLPHQGRLTPLLSSALFSLYHLWAPWPIISRVIFMLPGAWLVWKKKDLRLSIGMHAGSAFILQTLGTLALLLNLAP